MPASAVGTVGQEQEFLLVSWHRVCLMHHITGCYSQLRCSPKCQRPTSRCCSAISPRGLCRALVHRQQQNTLRAQRDLEFIRLQVQEPVSGSIQCVFSSLCQFPLRWLSLAGAAAPLQLRARGRGSADGSSCPVALGGWPGATWGGSSRGLLLLCLQQTGTSHSIVKLSRCIPLPMNI